MVYDPEDYVAKRCLVARELGEDLANKLCVGPEKFPIFAPGDVGVDDFTGNLAEIERLGGYPVCINRPWNQPESTTPWCGERFDYDGALWHVYQVLKQR